MINRNPKEEKIHKWKKWRDIIVSTSISAIIGGVVGFYFDGFMRINPQIKNLEAKIRELTNSIQEYHKDAEVSIDCITYRSVKGLECKIGINDNVADHFISVTSNNPHNLKQGDKIYLLNENESDLCIYTKVAFVQIVHEVNNESSAEFFMNRKMLKRLGIEGNNLSKGVFVIHFKKSKD